MKTPDKNRNIPTELNELLQDLSKDEVAGLNEVWGASNQASNPSPDVQALDKVWSNIESQLDNAEIQTSNSPSAQIIPMRWMAIAATILIGAFGLAYFLTPLTETAPLGEIARVILHDGTQVELNSGSSLRYGKWFGRERRVWLTGEAYFDVVEGKEPFIVETFNASVTVLGTTFNVRAWAEDKRANTKVSLQTGSVLLAGLSNSSETETITLIPGQAGVVNNTTFKSNEADTVQVSRALAWREGHFFFSNEWLGSILDDVERRFDTEVRLTPLSLKNKRMKLALEKPSSAEAVVKDISETLGLKYRETALGYEIFDPN